MKTPPPPPPRATTNTAPAQTHGLAPELRLSDRPVSAPLAPLAAVAACVLASTALFVLGWRAGAGETAQISPMAVFGWLLGGVAGLLMFAWYRSADSGRQSDPLYVDRAWRPRRVASVLAVMSWLAGIACAVLIASSWARR
jgi:hypothetical protein